MGTADDYIQKAITLSIRNVEQGGGPFGAVIVKDGQIVATGVNQVVENQDPTAHAEIQAIREAAINLQTFDLSGCEIYSSCEPCPMCLSAIYWARIDKIYYANNRMDAAKIGFSDATIYTELNLSPQERRIPCQQINGTDALKAFKLWIEKENKIQY